MHVPVDKGGESTTAAVRQLHIGRLMPKLLKTLFSPNITLILTLPLPMRTKHNYEDENGCHSDGTFVLMGVSAIPTLAVTQPKTRYFVMRNTLTTSTHTSYMQ